MARIDIKPLSVNKCFQGRRFRTKDYDVYEKGVMAQLVSMKMPPPPLTIEITAGFSNKLSDLDNCLKPFIDCLQKRYGFNDRDIYMIIAKKVIVDKNKDFIEFNVYTCV